MKTKNKIACVVFSALLLLFSLFSDFCFAYQPDSDRWMWLGSSDTMGVWFDSETVCERQRYGTTLVYIWVLFYHNTPAENTPSEYTEKSRFVFDLNDKTMDVDSFVRQDMNGNVLLSGSSSTPDKEPIVPGTYSEALYKIATTYHDLHNRPGAIR